jgi:osmotically-inducible protein OsmY
MRLQGEPMACDRLPGTRQGRGYDGGCHPHGPGRRPGDRELAEQVRERLVRDERLDARRIAVEVEAGVVTLSGEVGTLVAKRDAGDAAWDTAGIADVRNLLTVAEPEPVG